MGVFSKLQSRVGEVLADLLETGGWADEDSLGAGVGQEEGQDLSGRCLDVLQAHLAQGSHEVPESVHL